MTHGMTNERNYASPRLALVLGSGGVRSAAALGIADVLTTEGFKPELIVGCSSGAIFGATLAMGLTSAESLKLAMRLWSADLTQKKRWGAYAQLVAPRLMGFDASFSLRDSKLIACRMQEAFGDARLESLPTRFRVVTTDMLSGEGVVLEDGSVVDALRASIAVPFLFPSVELKGRRLADGVISNPLPISVATDARATIALGFRGVMPRRIDRPSRLIAQVSTAMINNLQQAQIATARAAMQRLLMIDLNIDRRIGLWETAAMPRIFVAGQRAARQHLQSIRELLQESSQAAA